MESGDEQAVGHDGAEESVAGRGRAVHERERKQAVHAGIREGRIPDRLDSMTGKHP